MKQNGNLKVVKIMFSAANLISTGCTSQIQIRQKKSLGPDSIFEKLRSGDGPPPTGFEALKHIKGFKLMISYTCTLRKIKFCLQSSKSMIIFYKIK